MEKNLSKKNYSIIAGAVLLLYSLYNIGQKVYGVFSGSGVLNFSYFAFIVPILVLSIMLLVKRNNLVIPISLGIVALVNFYWCIKEISYLFEYFSINELLWFIGSLLTFISPIFLALLSLMSYKKTSGDIGKLWFIPAVLEFLCMIILVVIYIGYGMFTDYIGFVIEQTIYCVGFAFAGLSFSLNIPNNNGVNPNSSNYTQSTNDNGYCDMTKHILLLIFIGWIWQYIWIYRTTDYLNKTPNEEKRNPATKLLLCMFVPFYYIYWIYQSARRIEILAKEKNIDSDIVTLSVVLSLFIGIVPPIIMQSKLNQVCKCDKQTPNVSEINTTVQNAGQKVEINSDKTDEIRNYKKLLDDGIITEEEFEAKKKQLLGL